jgi:hypothetical protein
VHLAQPRVALGLLGPASGALAHVERLEALDRVPEARGGALEVRLLEVDQPLTSAINIMSSREDLRNVAIKTRAQSATVVVRCVWRLPFPA